MYLYKKNVNIILFFCYNNFSYFTSDNKIIHFITIDFLYFRQNNAYLSSENDGDPEVMLELLARIGQNIMRVNELEK